MREIIMKERIRDKEYVAMVIIIHVQELLMQESQLMDQAQPQGWVWPVGVARESVLWLKKKKMMMMHLVREERW